MIEKNPVKGSPGIKPHRYIFEENQNKETHLDMEKHQIRK